MWGTDCLWYGSPQAYILRLREFPRENETLARDILASYGLPFGLDGDVNHPTRRAQDPTRTIRNGILGRNAAVPYGIDPAATLTAIGCDKVQRTRQDYLLDPGTLRERAPLRSNVVYGYRTRSELLADIWPNRPWAP